MTELSDGSRLGAMAGCDFTAADFDAIARMLHEDAGITLGEDSRQLVFSRLNRHVRRLGLTRFSDYIALVRAPDQRAERYRMVTSLTTHTTRFFRESEHFDYLAEEILPALIAPARAGRRLRFWSAGCSTGEEAYSIAATVLAAFPDAGRYDVKILATDISREVLETAVEGRYRDTALSGLQPRMREILFEPGSESGSVRVRTELREMVTFRYLNFMEPWPLNGPFDAILCRNVAIYMAEDMQARIWAGLETVLGPEGTLFIGHSERLGPEFRNRLELCGKTTFCRAGDARLSSERRTL